MRALILKFAIYLLLCSAALAQGAPLTGYIGSGSGTFGSICSSAISTQLLYDNAGACGSISGWTTNGSTALTGGASTTVAIGGATIGTNALAVTGTTNVSGSATLGTAAVRLWSTDTGLSRVAAGVVGLGTGAAASTAGAAIAANFQTGGTSLLTLTAGALGMSKMTASASAPGAAGAKLELVCGTNAGTAKLVIAAGTSGTAVTVTDNIGAGVTGC